jgi:hypothetical protein
MRFTKWFVAAAVVLAGAAATLALAGTPAVSATTPAWEPDPNALGTLTFHDKLGNPITGGTLSDQPPAFYVAASGPGRPGDSLAQLYLATPRVGANPLGWSKDIMSGATAYPNVSAPANIKALSAPVATSTTTDLTFAQYIQEFPNTVQTDGYKDLYEFRLYTSSPSQLAGVTYYRMVIQVTVLGQDKDGLVTGNWSAVYPAARTPTATALTASPASPAANGAAVTLTATVTPASAGTVRFFDGTADLGTGGGDSGTASLTIHPADGTHSFTAQFTPTDPNLSPSTSPLLSYRVGLTAANPTATTLDVSPPSPVPHGTKLAMVATVTPTGVAGGVDFFDGAQKIGTGGYDKATGKASLDSVLPDGEHAITARFVSDDLTVDGSTSEAALYLVQSTPPPFPTSAPQTTPPAAPAGAAPHAAPVAAAPPVAASNSASAAAASPSRSPQPNPTVPVTGALTLASSTSDAALLAGLATVLVATSVVVTVLLRRYRARHPRPPTPQELR